jgi:hypothetical protein
MPKDREKHMPGTGLSVVLLTGGLMCCTPCLYADDAQSVRERYSIEAPDLDENQSFGQTIYMKDGLLFIGDRRDDISQPDGGSVRVYDAVSGELITLLTPPDLEPGDNFGAGMALAGNRLVIGADSNDNFGNFSGTAHYIDLSTGRFLHRFAPSDLQPFSRFGTFIDMADGLIAIDAQSAVYLYNWDTCQLIRKMTPPEGSNDSFGGPLAIDQGLIAVAAPTENDNEGVVHLYDLISGEHLRQFSVPGAGNFGRVLDMRDGLLAVGTAIHEGVGAAFVFDAHTGEMLNRFTSGHPDFSDYFGRVLKLGEGQLFVSAQRASFDENRQGTVYAFDTETFEMLYRLVPDETERDEEFGQRIAADANFTAVGGMGLSYGGAGRASVFRMPDPACIADSNCDGRLDFYDVSQFLVGFVNQQDLADLDGDGAWNFFDVSSFLILYLSGCEG